MSNAFDAIYDEEQSTSNSFSNIDSFKSETSKKAGEIHRITYEEIFNITQSLEPVQAKFKTLDEPEKQEFKSKVSEISNKYAKKASEVSEDLVLSENEKKYEINSLMGDMVEELTEAATGVFSKNIMDDTAEAAQGTYSDLVENKKVPSISEETRQNVAGDISGAKDRIHEMSDQHHSDTIEETNKNLITELSHIAITETLGSIVNSDTTAYLVNPTLLAKDITESFNDSVIDLVQTAKQEFIDTPAQFADSFVDLGKGIAETVVDAPVNFIKSKIQGISGDLNSFKDEAIHKVADKVMNLRNTAASKLEQKLVGDDPLSTKTTGTEAYFDLVTVAPISRDQFRVLSATTQDLKFTSRVNESIYMSLDNYWDVDINVPLDNLSFGLPSFREAYGLEEYKPYYHLPITSFALNGEGIVNTEESLYPGLSVSMPFVFQKPSKLNIQLPELIHRKVGEIHPCMMKFKHDYINYVMGGYSSIPGDKTNYAFRNFRECVYQITIRKFSPRWELLQSWGYYGIPDVSMQESGSSSPTVEFSELTFSIVGEFTPKYVNSSLNFNTDDGLITTVTNAGTSVSKSVGALDSSKELSASVLEQQKLNATATMTNISKLTNSRGLTNLSITSGAGSGIGKAVL